MTVMVNASETTDDFVASMRVPLRYRLGFLPIAVLSVLGGLCWIAAEQSLESILFGGLIVVCLGFALVTSVATHHTTKASGNKLVLTRDTIQSPFFTLRLDQIRSAWIGRTNAQTGSHPVLNIEPYPHSAVRWAKSRVVALNVKFAAATGQAPVQILQVNVDRPLEEILNELERRAGRRLHHG